MTGRRRKVIGLAVLGATVAAIAAATAAAMAPHSPLVVHNPPRHRSMPAGIYLLSASWPPEPGDVVIVRDSARFNFHAGALIKRTVAVQGSFCWSPAKGVHTIDGEPVKAPAPQPHPDAGKHGLEPWPGCRELAPDEIVAFGDTADSYDSRYLGPLRRSDFLGVYRGPY